MACGATTSSERRRVRRIRRKPLALQVWWMIGQRTLIRSQPKMIWMPLSNSKTWIVTFAHTRSVCQDDFADGQSVIRLACRHGLRTTMRWIGAVQGHTDHRTERILRVQCVDDKFKMTGSCATGSAGNDMTRISGVKTFRKQQIRVCSSKK